MKLNSEANKQEQTEETENRQVERLRTPLQLASEGAPAMSAAERKGAEWRFRRTESGAEAHALQTLARLLAPRTDPREASGLRPVHRRSGFAFRVCIAVCESEGSKGGCQNGIGRQCPDRPSPRLATILVAADVSPRHLKFRRAGADSRRRLQFCSHAMVRQRLTAFCLLPFAFCLSHWAALFSAASFSNSASFCFQAAARPGRPVSS